MNEPKKIDRIMSELADNANDPYGELLRQSSAFMAQQHKQENVDTISSMNETPPTAFSFFKAPIKNTRPFQTFTLVDAYNYIVSDSAKQQTEHLRTISNTYEAREFKKNNFAYCTFSGTFTARSNDALVHHSGLLCVDLDHLPDVPAMIARLLRDDYFETQLLFRSPSGDGLKWIIPIDITLDQHNRYFQAVANYIRQKYGVGIDMSGSDVSRACYLPHDPDALYKPN